jgi:uncharacterized oxidoreductase
MLPAYVRSLNAGLLFPNRTPDIVTDTGAILAFDGRRGYGQAVGRMAMQQAIARADEHGLALMTLRNTHHLGRIGTYGEQAVAAGLVSMHFVNVVTRPIVAPFGGLDARTGTNPVCIGIPRSDGAPLLLDFATSRIAQGKTRVAHNRGEPVAPGMLLDAEGRPSTDPRHAVVPPFGALLPFGEHKGFGLAVAAELLGGALAGGPTCHGRYPGNKQILNGMLSVLFDAERLGTTENFEREASAYLDWVRQSPAAEPGGRVQLPGEPELERREQRRREGIRVDAGTWGEILDAAALLGIDRGECERLARG